MALLSRRGPACRPPLDNGHSSASCSTASQRRLLGGARTSVLNGGHGQARHVGPTACADLDLPVGRRDIGDSRRQGFHVQASRRFSTALGLLIAAWLIALVAPSLARAGTAEIEDPDPGGPHLTFTAASGEANHLLLLLGLGGYRVVDLGAAITAGPGCTAVNSSEVLCVHSRL